MTQALHGGGREGPKPPPDPTCRRQATAPIRAKWRASRGGLVTRMVLMRGGLVVVERTSRETSGAPKTLGGTEAQKPATRSTTGEAPPLALAQYAVGGHILY